MADRPPDPIDRLDALFLGQYRLPLDGDRGLLLAAPAVLRAARDDLLVAIDRPRLPQLDDDMRTVMTGRLTPDHRELMLDLVGVLVGDDARGLAAELGFGAEVFEDILRRDRDLENLGAALDDLGRALAAAESLHNRTLAALNARVLLAVEEALDEMDPAAQGTERDELRVCFRAAREKQAEIFARQAGTPPPAGELPRTLEGLKQQLAAATQDADVLRNLASIAAVARRRERQGAALPPAVSE